MAGEIYVIDTSSLIRIKPEDYPHDIFVTLWSNMENLVKSRRLMSSKLVLEELKKKNDDIYKWAKRNEEMFKEITTLEQTELVKQILKKFPSLIDPDGQVEADPFVITLALQKESQQTLDSFNKEKIVVTEEILQGNKIKIPFVCQHFGIECINIFDLFRREGWQW